MYESTFDSTVLNSNRLREYQLSQISAVRLYYDPAIDPNPDDNLTPLEVTVPLTDDRVVVDTSVDGTAVIKLLMECNGDDVPAGTKFNAFHLLGITGETVPIDPPTPPEDESIPEPVEGVSLHDNSGTDPAGTSEESTGDEKTDVKEEGTDNPGTNPDGTGGSTPDGSTSGDGSTSDAGSTGGTDPGQDSGESTTDPSQPTPPQEFEVVTDILYVGTVPPSRSFYEVGDTATIDLTLLF